MIFIVLTPYKIWIKYSVMGKMNKGIVGAIIAGIIGIFLACFGFWRTILILFLIVLGFLIGTYLETKKKE